MARAAPGVKVHGTARDLTEQGAGYSANGISLFSRHAAHGGTARKEDGPKNNAHLIPETEKALAKLERDIRIERNPTRLAKLQKNRSIKTSFLETLIEQAPAERRTGRVIEIGEDRDRGFIRDDDTGHRFFFWMKASHGEEIGVGDIVDFTAQGQKAIRLFMNVKRLVGEDTV